MTKTKKATKKTTKRQPIADPEDMNQDRASWARAAVQTFQAETGLGEADGIDTAIMDLLADLAHLCDEEGFDFGQLISRAKGHYTEETYNDDADETDGHQFDRIDILAPEEDEDGTPGGCLTCGTQCDQDGICPLCDAYEKADDRLDYEACGRLLDTPIESCRKCGALLLLRDAIAGNACTDAGEGPEAGKVFVYCGEDCRASH